MFKVCANCKHLITEPEGEHVCPTEEHRARLSLLVTQAAIAEEVFGLDALEEWQRLQNKEKDNGYNQSIQPDHKKAIQSP